MSGRKASDIQRNRPAVATPEGMSNWKELSAFAFQRTRMPMVLADARLPDCPLILANDAFLTLTGYSAEDLVGRNCRLLQGEGTSQTAVSQIRAAVAQEREIIIEILNYKKDGTPFWNQLHLSPIYDDGGELAYYFASQSDVTEHRRIQELEEAERRLLLEVDHRTKNVLAIVDSVVRLSRADTPQTYAAAVQQRVQALSRTHVLLAANGWQEVDLKDIIQTQVDVFDTGAIDIDGPPVPVPAPSAQPIGLALHELAANAAVHGALAHQQGRLTITWQQSDHGLTLNWRETNAPITPPDTGKERRQGFGNVVLSAVIENQLGGRICRDWSDQGLALTMQLPAFDRVGGHLKERP